MIIVPQAHRAGLLFSYDATRGPTGGDQMGRYPTAPKSATAFGNNKLGRAAFHTAANSAVESPALGSGASEHFRREITIGWVGELIGGRINDYGAFIGLSYGDASTSPFWLANIARPPGSNDLLWTGSCSAVAYAYAEHNVSLSSLYGVPLVLLFSNQIFSNVHTLVVCAGGRPVLYVGTAGAASAITAKPVTSTDRICLGSDPINPDRLINGSTNAAFIWQRAMPGGEMLALAAALTQPQARSRRPERRLLEDAAPATAPEIAVTGNGNAITDGDATPSATDHTDFGTTPQGTTKPRTFTIENSGDANLVISSVALLGAGAAEFTITANPTGTIAPAGTGTLTVRADAANQGTFSATVTINSNDANEAAFDFAIAVEVTEPASGSVRTARTDAIRGTVFGVIKA